jgi:hypothetical protein
MFIIKKKYNEFHQVFVLNLSIETLYKMLYLCILT